MTGAMNEPGALGGLLGQAAAYARTDQIGDLPAEMAWAQNSLQDAMAAVAARQFVGRVAGDRVEATVDAWGTVIDIRISTLAKREIDNLTLGDRVVEAVEQARAAAKEAWREAARGITVLGVPVDFGGMPLG